MTAETPPPAGRAPRRLAIRGGTPRFASPLHVGRPNLGDREAFFRRAGEAFDRCWLTNNGELLVEFENRLTDILGVRHCIAVCNGTVALQMAIRALELQGEVIVPSFTFVATVHALAWMGLTPVFCDIDPVTHSLDPHGVERCITPRTSGIMGVHLWGRPCDVESLEGLARANGLHLLFDAAHAFGSARRGRMIGNFGAVEAFSFHATKIINTFEGGALTTNDDDLADRLRVVRNFGFAGKDFTEAIGTNGKLNEISAAMGLTSLDSHARFVAAHRRHYETYRGRLDGVAGIRFMEHDGGERGNYPYIVIEVDAGDGGLDRDLLYRVLRAENILARRYYWPPCHLVEPYRTRYPEAADRLPVTASVSRRVLALPTGTALAEADVHGVCDVIESAVAQAPDLTAS